MDTVDVDARKNYGSVRFVSNRVMNEKGVIHIFAILVFLVLSGVLLTYYYGADKNGATLTASNIQSIGDGQADINAEQIRQLSYTVIDFSAKAAKMQVDIALNSWQYATFEQKQAIKSLVFNTVQTFNQTGNSKNIETLQGILQSNPH